MKTPAKAAGAVTTANTMNTSNSSNAQAGNNNLGGNSNLESAFFEDNKQQQQQKVQQFAAPGNAAKRPISLDLNTAKTNPAKKQRMNEAVPTPMLLESLATPELEKILMPMGMGLLHEMNPVLSFPSKVTSEQEGFAKGFVEALQHLQNTDNANAHSNGMSGGSFTYTNLDDSFPVAIKDEPQNPPASPPQLTPIDLENQEKIKLERKRQRNRVAASKCRKRKLERISKLEDKVKLLKGENADLSLVVKNLKEHVIQLKQQVIDHIHAGCNISQYNGTSIMQCK